MGGGADEYLLAGRSTFRVFPDVAIVLRAWSAARSGDPAIALDGMGRCVKFTEQSTKRNMGRTSNAKERLLQVASDVIWRQSYGAVSVDDICERAKVKKGSFYYFFPSKSDLAVAAYEEHWRLKQPKYDQVFSPLVPPLERIENYCQMVYENQKEKQQKTRRVGAVPFPPVWCELG